MNDVVAGNTDMFWSTFFLTSERVRAKHQRHDSLQLSPAGTPNFISRISSWCVSWFQQLELKQPDAHAESRVTQAALAEVSASWMDTGLVVVGLKDLQGTGEDLGILDYVVMPFRPFTDGLWCAR